MATTVFFDETIHDKKQASVHMSLEFGRSSFYDGENLVYLRIDDKSLVLDQATGRRICAAMQSLGQYLGYNR